MSNFKQVCEIGFRHALTGMNLLKSGCLAAVEVLEGKPRELKRKRRQWTGLSKFTCSSPPMFEAIQRRFQTYSGGQPLRRAQILEELSQIISKNLPTFKYFKSASQFRSAFPSGYSFVGFSYGHGSLSLQFGVRHRDIAKIEGLMFLTDHSARRLATISMLSVNMGPRSPHWPHPAETTWPVSGTDGLRLASSEIIAFIRDIAEPYVIQHRDPAAIRNTLLNTPRHATFPVDKAPTIFAIDCWLDRRDWCDEDYEHLRIRFEALDAKREQEKAAPPREISGFQVVMMMGKLPATHMVDGLKRTYQLAVTNWNAARSG